MIDSLVKKKIIISWEKLYFLYNKKEDLITIMKSSSSYAVLETMRGICMLQKKREAQLSFNLQSTEMKCVCCGTCHSRNRCPAHRVQCTNCKG